MNKELPAVVFLYIESSNKHDTEGYINTFSDQAVVIEKSIGKDLSGKEELKDYFQTYFVEYDTDTEIVEYSYFPDGRIDMKVLFRGDFSEKETMGSYVFTLKDDLIAVLEADLL